MAKIIVPAAHHDYLKYMFEGTSLLEYAQSMRTLADQYEEFHNAGGVITDSDGPHVFYEVPGHDIEVDEDAYDNGGDVSCCGG